MADDEANESQDAEAVEAEPSGPGPRVIVRVSPPGPTASWSTGGATLEQARRAGLTMSCALSFPARRVEVGELRRRERLRDRPPSDRELLGGAAPERERADEEAPVNVRVTVGEDRVMPGPDGGIVVVDDDAPD